MNGSNSPNSTPNYGLHLLKVVAIFFQIEVHAYSWLSRILTKPAEAQTSLLHTQFLLLKGGFSLLVPITAAAILRLSLPIKPGATDIPSRTDLSPYYSIALYLVLLESIKQVFVYGWGSFFSWDALHLIALCMVMILWVSQYSLLILWPVAIGIFALTPLILKIIEPWDKAFIPLPPHLIPPAPFNSLAMAYMLVWTLLLGGLSVKYFKNTIINIKHKKRGALVILALWLLGIGAATLLTTDGAQHYQLKELAIGIIIGNVSGIHIWGFFPWAGMIVVGFLTYDLVLRTQAKKWFLWGCLSLGLVLLSLFFLFFSESVLQSCSSQSTGGGFNAACFNRTPSQVLLAIGLFLVSVPVCIWGEKWGLENSIVRSISRSVLWIYIFQTSVMVWLSRWWIQVLLKENIIAKETAVDIFTLLSLVICLGIGIGIDRFFPKITIKLKRTQTS